jgi:hypothetical protein
MAFASAMISAASLSVRRSAASAHCAALDGAAHVENLLDRRLVGVNGMVHHHGENISLWRGDARATSIPMSIRVSADSDRKASHDGARHAGHLGERAFARQRITGLKPMIMNVRPDGAHDGMKSPIGFAVAHQVYLLIIHLRPI